MFNDNEKEWQLAKPLIDNLFKEGVINYDEWYFLILTLRQKLGLLTF